VHSASQLGLGCAPALSRPEGDVGRCVVDHLHNLFNRVRAINQTVDLACGSLSICNIELISRAQ